MKLSKLLVTTLIVFSVSMNNIAFSKGVASNKAVSTCNVAVVNIEKIVESSPQINALKADRKNKLDALAAFIVEANANLKKETDEKAKKTLEEKYNQELIKKREAIDLDFAKKLEVIDGEITTLIKAKGKKAGFDLILNKNTVIDGGTDITADVVKGLK